MKAEEFAARHRSGPIVVIPNAFDAGSAKVIARARPIAIGTSSAGIANGLGYADGEVIPRDEMLAAIKRIVDAVDIGVTAEIAIERGNAYLAAGADCVFAPGISDFAAVVAGLDGPLNAYAGAGTPTVGELEALGVRRVSVGNAPYDACLRLVERITAELLTDGRYDTLFAR
jgi:2-methylisocitrate lyase-like PEP mutase family enzyme